MNNFSNKSAKRAVITRSVMAATLLGTVGLMSVPHAEAAIALDRTRAIINGGEKSISLNISNENKQLPYLAQGWIENAQGDKITEPFTLLPPVQRLEPGAKSQLKVQALPGVAQLPQDRESVFYLNLREIPPKSDKPNTLQLALQTRIKLFYRPKGIVPNREQMATPWQESLTLSRQGDKYTVNNPTPFYVTLVDAVAHKKGPTVTGFEPVMIAPKSSQSLTVSANALGDSPILTYINDYGGRPALTFQCQASTCQVVPEKK